MKILIADDDIAFLRFVEAFYKDLGHDVMTVSDGMRALKAIRVQDFDVVLLDFDIPEITRL